MPETLYSSYVGQIGKKIKIDAGEDISSASVLKIKYEKPITKTTGEWVAVLEGTDFLYFITTLETDLNEAGKWILHPYIEMGTWEGVGGASEFVVKDLYEI